MHPDRVKVHIHRRLDSLSTRPEDPNTLTSQFTAMNNTPRDIFHVPLQTLFTYFLNRHYSILYIVQFHVGNTFLFSRVALEVDIFLLWGVEDPLFFSVIGDAVTIFI